MVIKSLIHTLYLLNEKDYTQNQPNKPQSCSWLAWANLPLLQATNAKDLRSVYHQLRRTLNVQTVIKLWNSLSSLKQANHSKLLT